MNKQQLKERIISLNEIYRNGVEEVPDAEYDLLLSEYESLCTPEEFDAFRVSLTEEKGEYKFDFVVGSLLKVKYENSEELYKWINKNNINLLWCSEKLDGCSGLLFYNKGKLVSAFSRGDGSSGTDWTSKALKIDSIPKEIVYTHPVYIRGEFILTGDSHIKLGMSNRRNAVVGIMNRKEVSEDVSLVEYFAYEVLSEKWFIEKQFEFLISQKFKTPKVAVYYPEQNVHEEMKSFYISCKKNSNYDIDGIVVSDKTFKPEPNEFYPKKKIAFKVNSEGYECEVVDIHWEISKQQSLKPVIQINPTEMDGAIVSRITAFNAKFILENRIGKKTQILAVRSGAVIPHILRVIEGVDNIELPTICPSCGNQLKWKGVDLYCDNSECGASSVKKIYSFLKDCEVENVAVKTLDNWNISTFEDLLSFAPQEKSKSENKFYNELINKVFTKPAVQLFSYMVFDGCGTTNINKIVDYYGFENFTHAVETNVVGWMYGTKGFPEGIGEKTILKLIPDWKTNIKNLELITTDSRYNPKEEIKNEKEINMESELNGKTILFTGTLTTCKRTEAETKAKECGATIASSVNKNLNYLVVGEDQWGKSSKFVKAESLNIPILTESEFFEMVN